MSGRAVTLGTVLFLLLSPLCTAREGFLLREGDLPEARLQEFRIAFTRNGALAVAREGVYMFDVGLGFADKKWDAWGSQIRRSEREDHWTLTEDGKLRFAGTLSDSKRNPRFSFIQEVTLTEVGLRMEFRVDSLSEEELLGFGVIFHSPVSYAREAVCSFWPGYGCFRLPEESRKGYLTTVHARGQDVTFPDGRRVAMVGANRLKWQLFDDRAWELNVFRSVGWDGRTTRNLNKDGSARFVYELVLADLPRVQLSASQLECAVSARGRVALRHKTRKLAEGGIINAGDKPRWAFLSAAPAAAGDGESACKLTIDNVPCTARFALEEDSGDVRIRYNIAPEANEDRAVAPRAALAFPVRTLEGEPAIQPADPDSELHRVTLRLKSGIVLQLAGTSDWQIDKAKYGGTDCYVASQPIDRTENLKHAGWITVSVHDTSTEDAAK